jgi:hypothetical protein
MSKEIALQKLLNRISSDSRKAHELAQELYGPDAFIFLESDNLFAMDGDEDGGATARQSHIRLSGKGLCKIGGGAW